ncbi:MAG: tryptophan-rich sensory protein [Deltaproteobacteria bacterium]
MAASVDNLRAIAGLIASFLICFGAARVGVLFTDLSVSTWYPSVVKPAWTPSGNLIGGIWTVLFTLMAFAAWLVWLNNGAAHRRKALLLFVGQLVLNVTWSAMFFGLRSPGLAAIEIIVLWMAILATVVAFARVSKVASALMVPYLLWVAFAAVLNVKIWSMN